MGTNLLLLEIEKAADEYIAHYSDQINELNEELPGLAAPMKRVLKSAFIDGAKRGVMLSKNPANDIQ